MAKQYGDSVQYVHNISELVTNEQGNRVRVTSQKTSNALVLTSSIHEGREQLQLVYLDEAYNRSILGGSDVANAVKVVFAFPLVQVPFQSTPDAPGVPKIPAPANAQGWVDVEPVPTQPTMPTTGEGSPGVLPDEVAHE